MLLDGQLTIISASASFCDLVGENAADLPGQALYALDGGDWDVPELRVLMGSALAGEDTPGPRDLERKGGLRPVRNLLVQARRLTYLDPEQIRILVAVSDVTDLRAEAALRQAAQRENEVLLHEVRHRVANSLQIIASVLLQNARKSESVETRDHLMDAHHRVMSVAGLERLLSTSQGAEVEVHAYFTSLCETIAASMIGDPGRISLAVDGDEGLVAAKVSASLGLIVTELVINALKHAFPDDRSGKITIDYNFHGPNWILCVRDDGVGMPETAAMRPGLGTSIVQALARQLNASVEIAPEHPGTRVTIHHSQVALVQGKTWIAGAATSQPSLNRSTANRAEERS